MYKRQVQSRRDGLFVEVGEELAAAVGKHGPVEYRGSDVAVKRLGRAADHAHARGLACDLGPVDLNAGGAKLRVRGLWRNDAELRAGSCGCEELAVDVAKHKAVADVAHKRLEQRAVSYTHLRAHETN